MVVKKNENLKATTSDPMAPIDWTAVDSAPLANVPDDESPELTKAQASELRPLFEIVPIDD